MSYRGKNITKTVSKQQDLDCNDVRKIFFANMFDLPEGIEPSPALPKGYYSFIDEAFKKCNFLSKTEENSENYVVAIDMESKVKPEKFFRNMVRHSPYFDEDCKIQSIMIQKTGFKNSKKSINIKPIDMHEMRMIICIVDETTLFHTHLEIVSSNKKVQILNKTSYGTVVYSNSSQINISVSDEKSNSNMKLAEAYYIIIDFEPSPSFHEHALSRLIANHPTPPKMAAKKFSKNVGAIKDQFGSDNVSAIQKLIGSVVEETTKKEKKNFTVEDEAITEDFEVYEETEEKV